MGRTDPGHLDGRGCREKGLHASTLGALVRLCLALNAQRGKRRNLKAARGDAIAAIRADTVRARIQTGQGIVDVAEGFLRSRNQLYARVFDETWIASNVPDAELEKPGGARIRLRGTCALGRASFAIPRRF